MPTYEYACRRCGETLDAYRRVESRNDAPICCGKRMDRVYSAPMIFTGRDIFYRSPIDDRPITSMRERREDLARSNCREYDPEMKTDYFRRQKETEAALDKAVDETIDREIALMPAQKRERLEAELQGGMTVDPIRVTPPAKPINVDING